MYRLQENKSRAYMGTDCRIFEILMGCVGAILIRFEGFNSKILKFKVVLSIFSIIGIIFCSLALGDIDVVSGTGVANSRYFSWGTLLILICSL
jgi:hypothetical protein